MLYYLFLHGSGSSVDNHWQYPHNYHELLGQKICSIQLVYLLQANLNLNGTYDLLKWTGRILKRIKSFWNCSQNVAKKIDVKEHHFLEMLQTAKNFQRFPHTLIKQLFFKTAFADLFRFMYLCVLLYIDFQKQSMDIALKILAKYLETVVGEFHFRVNLHGFSYLLFPQANPFCRQVICLLTGRTTSKTASSSRNINKDFSVYIFLDSEPQLQKFKKSIIKG